MKAEKKAEPPAPKAGVGTPEPGCANHRHGPMGAPITEEPKQAKAKAKVKAKAKAKDAPDRTPGAFCGPGAVLRFALQRAVHRKFLVGELCWSVEWSPGEHGRRLLSEAPCGFCNQDLISPPVAGVCVCVSVCVCVCACGLDAVA